MIHNIHKFLVDLDLFKLIISIIVVLALYMSLEIFERLYKIDKGHTLDKEDDIKYGPHNTDSAER